MPTSRISTSCDNELKRQMLLQDIPFAKALHLGGTFLTNCRMNEEGEIMKEMDQVRKEIKVLNNKLNYLEKQLKDLKENKSKEDPKLKDKERMAYALKANNPLRRV